MKKIIIAASLISLFMMMNQASYANDGGQLRLSTGVDYNTGKYGGTQSTDILYIPVSLKYQAKLWNVKVTIPYLQITGPSNVLSNLGAVAAPGTVSTRSGMGDTIVSGSRMVHYDNASKFMVNLTGKIKLATADSTKGLGTGKNDYAIQADMYKLLDKLTAFGTVGYKVYGQPAAYKLYNALFVTVGGSYKIDQTMSGGIMFRTSQKTTKNGAPHSELLLFANQSLDKEWKAQYYLQKGFTKSVPDYGLGASVSYYF